MTPERFAAIPDVVLGPLAGRPEADWHRGPPGKWTPAQIVHHLAISIDGSARVFAARRAKPPMRRRPRLRSRTDGRRPRHARRARACGPRRRPEARGRRAAPQRRESGDGSVARRRARRARRVRVRSRTRRRRGAAPELPVRRPRQRVPATGLWDEPRPAARPARGRRPARDAGRAAAPGRRLMLRGTENLQALTPLVPSRPLSSQSIVVRRPPRMLFPSPILFRRLVHLVGRSLEPPLHRRLRIGDADGEPPFVLGAHDSRSARICFA